MKIILESTDRIVELEQDGAVVPARVWQGQTADGVPVVALVTRIAAAIPETHPDIEALTAQFEAELVRCAQPTPAAAQAFPLRLII